MSELSGYVDGSGGKIFCWPNLAYPTWLIVCANSALPVSHTGHKALQFGLPNYVSNSTNLASFSVFVEESSKKKKNPMDFLKALAILKVNPRELKKKILEVGCEEVTIFGISYSVTIANIFFF